MCAKPDRRACNEGEKNLHTLNRLGDEPDPALVFRAELDVCDAGRGNEVAVALGVRELDHLGVRVKRLRNSLFQVGGRVAGFETEFASGLCDADADLHVCAFLTRRKLCRIRVSAPSLGALPAYDTASARAAHSPWA